jgi:toxin ParE1/3/4
MMFRIHFEAEVESDLSEAASWYDSQRLGLGSEFLLAVEAALAAIQRSPQTFPKKRGQIRRALVRRFPYAVFFFIEDKVIHVIAILHAKRNPGVWRRRIER